MFDVARYEGLKKALDEMQARFEGHEAAAAEAARRFHAAVRGKLTGPGRSSFAVQASTIEGNDRGSYRFHMSVERNGAGVSQDIEIRSADGEAWEFTIVGPAYSERIGTMTATGIGYTPEQLAEQYIDRIADGARSVFDSWNAGQGRPIGFR